MILGAGYEEERSLLNYTKSLAVLAVLNSLQLQTSKTLIKIADCTTNLKFYVLEIPENSESYPSMHFLSYYSDIDECTEPGHGCSQLCNNTMGSYSCYCLKGYWLKRDNKTCVGKFGKVS